jgi:hypothetical protein
MLKRQEARTGVPEITPSRPTTRLEPAGRPLRAKERGSLLASLKAREMS